MSGREGQMALWVELHCDIDGDGCFNIVNHAADAGFVRHNSRELLLQDVRAMERTARTNGWARIKGKWACPKCQSVELEAES